jgi:N-acetylglucosaminyldiphosphoundecaprenol N-acetyl-beta-D-mannosaminyltransferase
MGSMMKQHPFGLRLSNDSAADIAATAITRPRMAEDGVGLVVTPNIDHIATIRRNPGLARAYLHAERIVCDGWPVQLYARVCGLRLGRVTGCEITARLMGMDSYPAWHRLFFVVDSPATESAVRAWAERNGLADRCAVTVPPFGFEGDALFSASLADRIAGFGATILIMAVGAPRSEIFVDAHRTRLPPCWAFCVGQAVKVELGLVRRAPARWRAAGVEWLWRVLQEPSRLTARYVTATVGFGMAVIEDQFRT